MLWDFSKRAKIIAALFCAMLLAPPHAAAQDASSGLGGDPDWPYDGAPYNGDDFAFFFEDEYGITIVATVPTSQQMAVIGREEIELRAPQDLAALLQQALGLTVIRHGGYGNQAAINMRGFDTRRVAFLINGVPANSNLSGRFDINQIGIDSIERVEVIFAGSDSRFNVPGALGGIINIITVGRREPGWSVGAAVSNTSALPLSHTDRSGQNQSAAWGDLFDGQHIGVSMAHGGGEGSFSANIFANRSANRFVFRDFLDTPRRQENNEVWDIGGGAFAERELAGFSRIIASSNFYHARRNFPATGWSPNYGTQIDFITRQSLMLEAPRAFRDDFSAEASLTWNFASLDFTDAGGTASRHYENSFFAISRWGWHPSNQLAVRAAFDYRLHLLDSTDAGNRSRHDSSVSLASDIALGRRFTAIPSVQAVFVSGGGGEAAVIPRLGFLFHATDRLTLTNNWFRSFRFPDFQDLYWTGAGGTGNPDLHNEDGWGGDLGAVWRGGFFVLESVFFAQYLRDSVHWFSAPGGAWQPQNAGRAMFFGLDTRLTLALPPPARSPLTGMTLSLSHHYLRSYLMSFGFTFADDQRIPYTPLHRAGFVFDFFWNTGSLSVSGHFEGERYHNRENLFPLAPFFLLDVTANQRLTDTASGFAAIRNILNMSYETAAGFPMPGASLTLGMRMRF